MKHETKMKLFGLTVFATVLLIVAMIPPVCSLIVYDRNESGESYGKPVARMNQSGFLRDPDLIEMTADNGKVGYVRKTDYHLPIPQTAEEVDIYVDKMSCIPVYENDGKTKIGEINAANHSCSYEEALELRAARLAYQAEHYA